MQKNKDLADSANAEDLANAGAKPRFQSMIRKSGDRFSEKIMLHQNAGAQIASI